MMQKRNLRVAWATIATIVLLAAGCGGAKDDKYEEFETLQLRERLVEVPLGQFSIPVPLIVADESGEIGRTNLMQIKFELHALVKPKFASDTTRLIERHEGQIRDRVIRVCRNATMEDLLDPQLSTLRSRTLDSIQSLFDGVMLKRILLTDIMTEPL